jgi:apolipoprotein D and lipocalin family protein
VAKAPVALLAILVSAVAGCAPAHPPLDTVFQVDLSRYLGRWYEIARYPAWFEKDCVGATADYSRNPDGTVKVVNSARLRSLDGPVKTAVGRARVVEATTQAKLKVAFFLFFEGDYWILELGENYDYALIGEPGRKYLWILSRTPQMDETLYQQILSRLPAKDYDPVRLIRTPQPAQP